MGASELLLLPLRLALLLAGLLVPGAALLRALRLPFTFAGSFLLSASLLIASVVVFAIFRLPVTLLTLSTALVTLTTAAWVVASRRVSKKSAQPPPAEDTHSFAAFTTLGWWTPLYAAFWLIVLWRLGTQPLTGADVHFRWSWLAEQIVRLGSLDFYPPRTAADYSAYPWPESLPPGIASLHAWSYLCGGTTRALWTSPAVLLQLLALHELIWRLAFSWGGEPAARRAVLLAAATPLLTWASLIGQETALTSLSVCGLLFGLLRWHKTHAPAWLAFAALASAAGAFAREYGPAFPLLGLGVLAFMRAPRRALVLFATVSLPLTALWPLRTWVLTGNPLFSLNLAGLFPVNPLFATWSAHFHTEARGALLALEAWRQIARYLILFAPAALFGALALFLHARRGLREARWCALCVATCLALWIASVPFTAGGLFYSLRVLSPAFALAAAFAGYAIMAADTPARRIADVALALTLLATLPFTLTLPENAYRLPTRAWPDAARRFEISGTQSSAELLAALRALPTRHGAHAHNRLLSDYAGLPHALAGTDLSVVPFWSPEVAWLFDAHTSPQECLRRWRASGLRYVVTSPAPRFLDFLNRHARWPAPHFVITPVWQSEAYVILEVITEPPAAR
jgi:hypothetical protein